MQPFPRKAMSATGNPLILILLTKANATFLTSATDSQPFSERFHTVPWPWKGPALYVTAY
jgi:hypothetical protein